MASIMKSVCRVVQTRPLASKNMVFSYRYATTTGKQFRKLSTGPPPYKITVNAEGHRYFHLKDHTFRKDLSIELPARWLRDSCRCVRCIEPDTKQRSFNIFEQASDDLELHQVTADSHGLKLVWGDSKKGQGHESFYEWDFIERWTTTKQRKAPDYRRELWKSSPASIPTVDYNHVMASKSNEGLGKLLDAIATWGLVFVENTPFDAAVHTEKLLQRIGPIRETHYGGFYDFVPDMAKADTAYTNIALPPHTDTTYFTDPAGLQAFHLLSHTASAHAPEAQEASGGESILVDGYQALSQLESQNRDHALELAKVKVAWHASGNEGITITPDRLYAVFDCSKSVEDAFDRNASSTLTALNTVQDHVKIRWNLNDRGVSPTEPSWMEAATAWHNIVSDPGNQYRFQLTPGRTLIFDNHRILHGRTAFVGQRRICGGYINRDDWVSCWRNTTLTSNERSAQVIG